MLVEILKDATLTVKAGQTVEVSPEQAVTAMRLGLVKEAKTAPKKAATRKTK